MTDNNHQITPPLELVDHWFDGDEYDLATKAARWGADQELDACCEWTAIVGGAEALRAARRPKPLSLKEQALALISHDPENQPFLSEKGIAIIRRALESLPE